MTSSSDFVQVAGTKISVLSDVSEKSSEIDVERAQQAKNSAEQKLSQNDEDIEAADALARAELRLQVAGV